MEQSVLNALQTLWGGSAEPVCAVNKKLEPVWAPDARTKKLLIRMSSELTVSSETLLPVLPPDGNVIFSDADGDAVRCTIRPIPAGDEPLFLLTFDRSPASRSFSPAETRAMLRAQSDAGHTAAAQFVQSLHFLIDEHPELNEPGSVDKWLSRAENACYGLLNSTAHCEEMLWYSGFDSESEEYKEFIITQDISPTLRRFITDVGKAVGSNLTVTESAVGSGLFAAVDEERLLVALLLMFITTHRGDPKLRSMRFSAERAGDLIRISMAFTPGSGGESCMHPSMSRDISLTGNEMLLSRFCETFSASLTRQVLDGFSSAVLELPAQEKPERSAPRLGSSSFSYSAGRFSMTRVLLTELLEPEDLAPME